MSNSNFPKGWKMAQLNANAPTAISEKEKWRWRAGLNFLPHSHTSPPSFAIMCPGSTSSGDLCCAVCLWVNISRVGDCQHAERTSCGTALLHAATCAGARSDLCRTCAGGGENN